MTIARFQELLTGLHADALTLVEKEELRTLLHDPERRPELESLFPSKLGDVEVSGNDFAGVLALVYEKILLDNEITGTAPVRSIRRTRWIAAACILIIVFVGGYFFLHHSRQEIAPLVETPVKDIPAPATNRARITLGNGQQVYLDSMATGALAQQGNTQVVKLPGGQVAYQAIVTQAPKEVLYNTLYNPRGSQIIHLTLADGSKVWLNAESSVKYPVVFVDKERRVEITGEAYFEVAENYRQPFIVQKGKTEVLVLGTHFNVNAYDNEKDLRVTLLEGSVKVWQEAQALLLQPGQQARVTDHIELKKHVDPESVMAWKNGFFAFEDADLPSVMRQIARWYDVEVKYTDKIPARTFHGKLRSSLTLSQVLGILTSYQVHYTIENRHQLTIHP